MPRIPDRIPWWRAACALSLLLGACATVPPQSLDVAQQREALLRLDRFAFAGRVTVARQGNGPANVDWRQLQDVAKVNLSGILGIGAVQLEYSPGSLTIVTGDDRFASGDAEQLLIRQWGFVPPFGSLRYWVLGLPAPGAADPITTYDADGQILQLRQQDWTVIYKRRVAVKTAAGVLQMPASLVATRDDIELRLVIHPWRIR